MQPYDGTEPRVAPRPKVDAGRLWSGGAAAAAVAALVAIVGVVVARGLFDIPVLAREADGTFGDASTWMLAAGAAVGALLATALIHVLLLTTPRPLAFFGWIVGLLTTVAVLVPFTADESLAARVATALIHLLIGTCIGSLVSGVAARSVLQRRTP